MVEGIYSPWELIAEYNEEVINARGTNYTSSFEIYKSKKDELAWSPYKDGHPHINPQKGVRFNLVTDLDIGRLLSEMSSFELKIPSIPAFLMVKDNKDLITKILDDLRNI